MRVLHPRPALGRQKFIGVEFVDGVAVLDDLHPEVVASLLQHGFTVEDDFAIVELDDGTVVGDGKSLATLPATKPRSKSQQKRLDELARDSVPLSSPEE